MFYSMFSAYLVIRLCKNKVFGTPFCLFQILALILQGEGKGARNSVRSKQKTEVRKVPPM